jgi:hypothetical protein
MPDTHYIEQDEEIISAVGRLRRSAETDNIFVFPKRALILQSIINLKLLEREAKKLGKRVIVMSQDEQGIRLAEKAGLSVQEYQDRTLRDSRAVSTARFTVRHGENIPMPAEGQEGIKKRSSEIGSSDFHPRESNRPPVASEVGQVQQISPPSSDDRRLRVRNLSPPLQTTLNSQRPLASQTVPRSVAPAPISPPRSTVPSGMTREALPIEQHKKIQRFFNKRESSAPSVPATSRSGSTERSTRHFHLGVWAYGFLGIVALAGSVALAFAFLLPKAIVYVEPQNVTQTVQLSVVGAVETSGTVSGAPRVPARYFEMEKTVLVTRPATGKDAGNAAKARGSIIITNDYSSAAQPLVPTTRFQSSDGKIFRLVEGVTIPGVVESGGKRQPGVIEATVVADETGSAFNLSPTTFTIPGFQGSPKYEKFSARSTRAFTGGAENAQGAVSTVSTSDVESAKSAAEEEARKAVVAEIEASLKEGEALLDGSLTVSLVGNPTVPTPGVAGESFDYQGRFLVRGFILSESALRAFIDQETAEIAGVTLRPATYSIAYRAVLPNFETRQVDLSVQSEVVFEAPLDFGSLASDLLGQDEEGIRRFLERHPEVKRLQVEFKPRLFIATIPNDPERVSVVRMDMAE